MIRAHVILFYLKNAFLCKKNLKNTREKKVSSSFTPPPPPLLCARARPSSSSSSDDDECRNMNATHDYMNTNLALDDDDDDDENEDALRMFVETLTLDRRNKNTIDENAPIDTFSLPPSLDHYLDQLLRNSSSDEDEENASMYEMRDAFASCVEEPQQRKKKRARTCLELIMNEERQYLPASEEAQLKLTTLMHDEKQEGILRFMTRDKDMDAWGMCMSDVHGIFFSSDDAIISANIPDQTQFPSREDAWQSEKTPEVIVEEIKKKRSAHAVPKSNRRAKPQNPSRSSQMRGASIL